MAVSYAEFKAASKTLIFDQFDKDGNGTLDVKELKDFIEKIKSMGDSTFVEMLTRADLDANGDGGISFDEFWASSMKTQGFEDEDVAAKDFESRNMSAEDWEATKEGIQAALQAWSSYLNQSFTT